MSDAKKLYVVMRRSGAIMRFASGLGSDGNSHAGPYTLILDAIANEHASAGGDYDRPERLFLNGELVVPRGLTDLAWEYQRDAVAARETARRAVNDLHRPAWLTDETPSFTSDSLGWRVSKGARS